MKKLFSIILVLVLSLSAVSALAADSPYIPPVVVTTPTPAPKTEPAAESIKVISDSEAAKELFNKLMESGSVDEFFGTVLVYDAESGEFNEATLSELFGVDPEKLTVNEFAGISYEGPADHKVTATFTVPSVYEEGQEVYVLIGILEGKGEDAKVTWYAFKATVEKTEDGESQVVVELPPELFKEMLNKECVVAIVSVTEE